MLNMIAALALSFLFGQSHAAAGAALAAVSGAETAPTSAKATDKTLSFAQGACGDCHAVEKPWLSPNPLAPPFASIANRDGLTFETLAAFLRDAHNYPEAMDFDLSRQQADDLAKYMLSLKDPNYTQPAQ